jgi:putative ATPase
MDRWNSRSLFNDESQDVALPLEGTPLAERMRPRSLAEFVGQTHLVGEGRILRRLLAGGGRLALVDSLGSPPAPAKPRSRACSRQQRAELHRLSAVFSA